MANHDADSEHTPGSGWTPTDMAELIRAVHRLTATRDIQAIVRTACGAARKLLRAAGATLALRDGTDSSYVEEDAMAPLWKGQRLPLSRCVSGWTMLHAREALIEDVHGDERVADDVYAPTFVKSMAIVPLRAADPIGALGVYWSVPHRPGGEALAALRALADTAAAAIESAQGYAQLEQQVLKRAAELDALNNDAEDFARAVSHDVRAPIRAISSFCTMIFSDHEAELSAEARRKLEIVTKEADRMALLIDALVGFSRRSRKPLQPTRLDMTAIVRRSFERSAERRDSRAIDFRMTHLPPAIGDEGLIERAWTELLANALKFSAHRTQAIVEVSGREHGDEVHYRIRDNGAGFDARYSDKLFKLSQRLHRDSEFPGAGIGLALVHRIVTRHGGRIWADGAPDAGATVEFTLPKG